jgi:predicted esterase
MTFPELTDGMMRLYTQGDYTGALELVEKNADHFPEQSVYTTFWKMCLLSRCGRADDVLAVFQQGLDSGLCWAKIQFQDADLDAVRDLPEFQRLMAIAQESYEEARKRIKRDQTILLPDTSTSSSYPLLVALHGGAGNKDSNLQYWESARQRGWLVLSPQSTQPIYPGAYTWIDPELAVEDLQVYFEQILKDYAIDQQRVVIAGFSQGSGMAIYAALSGKIKVRGFLAIGTYLSDPGSIRPLAKQATSVRGYFITGEKDRDLHKAREIQNILKENNIPFGEEVHSDLGHEFPLDFVTSFDKAIEFIFMEQE